MQSVMQLNLDWQDKAALHLAAAVKSLSSGT